MFIFLIRYCIYNALLIETIFKLFNYNYNTLNIIHEISKLRNKVIYQFYL